MFFLSPFFSCKVADNTIYPFSLKIEERYENLHCFFENTLRFPFLSSTSTRKTESFISPPKAPAFPRTAPPKVPGNPPAHSNPCNPRFPVSFTSVAICTPASARTAEFSILNFEFLICITRPGKPLSETKTLLPPDNRKKGSSNSFAVRTALSSSALVRAAKKYLAAPPMRNVVCFLSGTPRRTRGNCCFSVSNSFTIFIAGRKEVLRPSPAKIRRPPCGIAAEEYDLPHVSQGTLPQRKL